MGRKVGVQLARKKLASIGSIPYLCHRISITDQNQLPMYMQASTYQQVNHYYPYGGLMGESSSGDVQPYKYNGKRLDRTHGLDWYDYGARHLDAAVGSWPTMDPLAEKYYSISPYAYCGGNPVNMIDVNGCDYNVYYDIENNLIIISATYYANEESFEYAQQSVEFWNNLSRQYTIDGMSVVFDLSVVKAEFTVQDATDMYNAVDDNNRIDGTGEANVFFKNKLDSNVNGKTYKGSFISISNDLSDGYKRYTGAHEIGHSLGLVHSYSGLMTASAVDSQRKDGSISPKQISAIVRNAYYSTPAIENGAVSGKGSFHFSPLYNNLLYSTKFRAKKL